MTINLGSGGLINQEQWQNLTDYEKAEIAATLQCPIEFIDTQLSAGEQVQAGSYPAAGGEGAPSSTMPNLVLPDWSLISPESLALVQQFLSATGLTLEEAVLALTPGVEPEDELAYIQQAAEEWLSENPPDTTVNPEIGSGENPELPEGDTTTTVATGLSQIWTELGEAIQSGEHPIPDDLSSIYAGIASTDPAEVKAAIMQLIDLSSLGLSTEQQTFIEGKLDDLSNAIAASMAEGGTASFFIRLGIPELLMVQFATASGLTTDATLSDSDRTALINVLTQLSTNLAEVNFTVATGTPEPSPEYTQLTSGDSQQVTTLLTSIFNAVQMPEGAMTEEERSQLITLLAGEFTQGVLPPELSSCSEEDISAYLSSKLEELTENGSLSVSDAALSAISMYLLPALAQQIASINQAKCMTDLYSSDETVITGALQNLGGITDVTQPDVLANIPPEEVLQQAGTSLLIESYLQVLVKALAFMAQIRSLICSLEGDLSQNEANAKLANISAQVQANLNAYQSEIAEVGKNMESQLKAIKKAKLMKWLMPVITILVTIIMTIISVVATVFAGPSGIAMATLSVAIVAKLIVLSIVITVTVVLAVLTIVDACRSIAGKESMWTQLSEEILEACNSTHPPEWLKSLVSAIVQVLIAVFVTALTLGAGVGIGATMLAKSGIQAGLDVTKEMVAGIAKNLLTNFVPTAMKSVAVQLVMITVITPIMASGVVYQAILELIKACGSKDEKLNMILSIIIQVFIMIAILIIGRKVQTSIGVPGGATSLADKLKNIAKDFLDALKNAPKTIAQGVVDACTNILKMKDAMMNLLKMMKDAIAAAEKPTADTVKQLLQQILAMLARLAKSAGQSFITPFIPTRETWPLVLQRCLEIATELIKISTQIYSAKTSFDLADIQKQLADLQRQISALESSLAKMDMMNSSALDPATLIQHLGEDTKDAANDWSQLVSLVSQMTINASNYINALLAK